MCQPHAPYAAAQRLDHFSSRVWLRELLIHYGFAGSFNFSVNKHKLVAAQQHMQILLPYLLLGFFRRVIAC